MLVLSDHQRARAKRKARQILRYLAVTSPPVIVMDAMRRLGVMVEYVNLPNIDGITLRDGRNICIFINKSHGHAYKQFTLAHELGHIALDHIETRSTSKGLSQLRCKEANLFAGAFLVPGDLLYRETLKLGSTSVKVLARRFRAPERVVRTRLEELELVKRDWTTNPFEETYFVCEA